MKKGLTFKMYETVTMATYCNTKHVDDTMLGVMGDVLDPTSMR